jgi:cytochrome c-type biogenesis protein CcmE|tara:strand:+ start:145 stop:588 length:444 start_codon:yes stop_codon:yes gene_type:complete
MTPTRRRLTFIGLGFLSLLVASALALTAFEDTLVFFYSPSDIKEKSINTDKQIRIGGLVKNGSLSKSEDGITVRFEVTDLKHSIPAVYRGPLPDLFRENQGVVAEGHLSKGIFRAKTILAKHDENYMPKEVADSLKKAGKWKGENKN